MATRSTSIASLVNQIQANEIVLPDLQRDFVWKEEQIRLLFDSMMRGYPFGSLLFWNTQFREVPYREFVHDFRVGQPYTTRSKPENTRLRMVLDGQQRLQSMYVAIHGTYDGRRLFFNVTSGPDGSSSLETPDDPLGKNYRFEFHRDDEPNRAKRLIRVADVVAWAPRSEDFEIDRFVDGLALLGPEANVAKRNLRMFRRLVSQGDLVPMEIIDEEVTDPGQARTIDEILEIFVRVNSGGTRLTRSDLMFSLIKSKWTGAREAFDDLLTRANPAGVLALDKDFLIKGLLTITDKPPNVAVEALAGHWPDLLEKFGAYGDALRAALDFCQEPDVGLRSASLISPIATLHPIVYYLSRQPRASVPDQDRKALRTVLYFLLLNNFVTSDARIRWLREPLQANQTGSFPLEAVLSVITTRQQNAVITTTAKLLTWSPQLALNIAQPGVARQTLSWQASAEVDHIFPQSRFRPKHGALVDDIGNFAYLGKLRNIRKSNQPPAEYFAKTTDEELRDHFLIDDRALLAEDRFVDFVTARRDRIVGLVREFLGR